MTKISKNKSQPMSYEAVWLRSLIEPQGDHSYPHIALGIAKTSFKPFRCLWLWIQLAGGSPLWSLAAPTTS